MRWVAVIAGVILAVGIVGLLYGMQQSRAGNVQVTKPHSTQVR
jgi:hypothetical protein